jgi:hypothetical protein
MTHRSFQNALHGILFMPGAGMNHQPGGFVHHQQQCIFKENPVRHRMPVAAFMQPERHVVSGFYRGDGSGRNPIDQKACRQKLQPGDLAP